MSIVPLGFNRTSVAMQANRAYNNLSSAQSLLSKYEQQIMAQRRYLYGSDSPYQASTALTVLAQMERKAQNVVNLTTTQTYLTATDSTLSRFNGMTDDVRAMALDALNTTTSDEQRSVLAQSVQQSLQQMFDFGNYSFQGRYVFAGSTTAVTPFEWGTDSYTVHYRGSVTDVHSWSDTDLLSQSNMNGVDVFGAVSEPVRGKIDLNPTVRETTLLSELNAGKGVEKGSIRLSYTLDGTVTNFEVDLSQCVTLGDVRRAFENFNNPEFSIHADLTQNGLILSLPEGTPGSVTISEIGKGQVARQLGLSPNTVMTRDTPIVGRDLNPNMVLTTPLDDILGSKANLTMRFAGANNDILLQARSNGNAVLDPETGEEIWPLNDISVAVQADADLLPGAEFVEYDPETRKMLVHIHPEQTQANDIIRVINEASEAGTIPPLAASYSGLDQQRTDLVGTGFISLLPGAAVEMGTTAFGEGSNFDSSGLEIVNGNVTHSISFENCRTIGDLLAELNDPTYGLYAAINESGNGIDIRSRISGADFAIGENGGLTATRLGVRTTDLDTRLETFDFGRGVSDYEGPGTAATARYTSVTPNSGLLLRARNEGRQWNDYTLNFVPTNDPQGAVTVSMDEENKTVTIAINPGVTTACEIVDAFNAQPGPKQFFDLELDTTDGINTGQGVVYDGFVKTSGGVDPGIDFTITRNDGTLLEIDIHGAQTLGDVLRIINEHPDNADGLLTAKLSEFGNGIEIADRSFGTQSTRVDRTLLSTTAIELGLVNRGEEYRTQTEPGTAASMTIDPESLNGALLVTAGNAGTYANDVRVEFVEGAPPSFTWDATAKTLRFAIEPGATTANDIVELFQSQATEAVREMFDIQNGTNPDRSSSDGSGIVQLGNSVLEGGTDGILKGEDPNPQETRSLFTALIRMQEAMEKNDEREIERATQLLDDAVAKLTKARSTIGVMQSSLDNVQGRLEEEVVLNESTLNDVLRIDFADASLSYMAQQLSYQASMQMTSALFQMSLLNYL